MGRVKARLPLLLPGRPCKCLACVGPLSLFARWFSLASFPLVRPTAPLAQCLCALVFDLCLLWPHRIFLVPRYRDFSVWCCPFLSRLAGGGPEGSDGLAVMEEGSVVAWGACGS